MPPLPPLDDPEPPRPTVNFGGFAAGAARSASAASERSRRLVPLAIAGLVVLLAAAGYWFRDSLGGLLNGGKGAAAAVAADGPPGPGRGCRAGRCRRDPRADAGVDDSDGRGGPRGHTAAADGPPPRRAGCAAGRSGGADRAQRDGRRRGSPSSGPSAGRTSFCGATARSAPRSTPSPASAIRRAS